MGLNDSYIPNQDDFEILLYNHPYLMESYFNLDIDDREILYNLYSEETYNYFYIQSPDQLTNRDKMCFYNLLAHLIWYFTVGTRSNNPLITGGLIKSSSVGDVSLTYGFESGKEYSQFLNQTPMGQFYLICLKRKMKRTALTIKLVKGSINVN